MKAISGVIELGSCGTCVSRSGSRAARSGALPMTVFFLVSAASENVTCLRRRTCDRRKPLRAGAGSLEAGAGSFRVEPLTSTSATRGQCDLLLWKGQAPLPLPRRAVPQMRQVPSFGDLASIFWRLQGSQKRTPHTEDWCDATAAAHCHRRAKENTTKATSRFESKWLPELQSAC